MSKPRYPIELADLALSTATTATTALYRSGLPQKATQEGESFWPNSGHTDVFLAFRRSFKVLVSGCPVRETNFSVYPLGYIWRRYSKATAMMYLSFKVIRTTSCKALASQAMYIIYVHSPKQHPTQLSPCSPG